MHLPPPPPLITTAAAMMIATTSMLASLWMVMVSRAKRKAKENACMSVTEPTFPLGSLGTWGDLLAANRVILNEQQPIVGQWMFWKLGVAVVRQDHVDAVFKASVSRRMTPPVLNFLGIFHIVRFMGRGSVGIAEGTHWKDLRRSIAASLKPDYVKSLLPMMKQRIGDAMAYIQRQRSQQPTLIDFSPLMHALTIDIVCTTIFKIPIGALQAMHDGKPNELVEAFSFGANEMARRTSSFNPLDWIYWPAPFTTLARAHRVIDREMNRFLDMVIDGKQETIVSHLLLMEGNGREAILSQVRTLIWAGHDTTATATSFIFRMLAQYPSIQTQLRASLLMGGGGGHDIDKIFQNKELDAVVWETLRLHPPALWTNRGMTEDLALDCDDGKTLKLEKGNVVMFPIFAIHHSEMNWTRPEEFLPFERFRDGMDGDVIKNKGRLVPFGAGNRICPGNALAITEIKLIVADFVLRWEFRLSDVVPEIKAVGMFQTIEGNVLEVVEAPSVNNNN